MNKEELKGAVGSALGKFELKRKGWTWYSSPEGNLVAVDLQKSNYNAKYYVNICCSPAGMNVDGLPTPKEHKFPIRIRADGLFPSRQEDIDRAFDLDNTTLSDEQRLESILEIISADIGPFLQRIRDISGLKSAIAEGAFERETINRMGPAPAGMKNPHRHHVLEVNGRAGGHRTLNPRGTGHSTWL